jgi:hypothetical protein
MESKTVWDNECGNYDNADVGTLGFLVTELKPMLGELVHPSEKIEEHKMKPIL